jgi:Tol biopolymer transport system component
MPGNNLFDFPMHHQHPSWSRQGLVCFEDLGVVRVDSSGLYEVDPSLAGLWVLDPTSRERRRIISFGHTPTWSPDGSKIAFSVGQIVVVNADGSEVTQLTFDKPHYFPSWSPSGEWIAYDDAQHVWVMRADGTDPRNIGQVEQPGSRYPSWSQDGSKILFIGYVGAVWPTAGSEVFVMDASGTNSRRLSRNQTDDRFPVFSPDGRQIAYSGQFLGVNNWEDSLPQIWLMKADGTGARQITTQGGYHPSWSPDGTKIVFTRENWVCNTPENGVLWMIDVRTGVETQLTTKWPEQ